MHKKLIIRFLLMIAFVAVVYLVISLIVIQRGQINTLNRQLAKTEIELRRLEARLADESPISEDGAKSSSEQAQLSSKTEFDFMVWNKFMALFFTVVLAFITMFGLVNVYKIYEIKDRMIDKSIDERIERFKKDYEDFNIKISQQIVSDRIFRNLIYLTSLFASHKRISAAQDLINEDFLAYETLQFIEKVIREENERAERDEELAQILQQIVNKFRKQFD